MALFEKALNESGYQGGKKHWTDVIKNTGPDDFLIWRQPEEDFNTHSTLIVMPGEEALFIKDGNVEQVFDSGKYTLSTENYPFVSRLRNQFSGGTSVFSCVVYFVKTAISQEIRWGTKSPIQIRDKILGLETHIKGYGAYKVKVRNGSKLLNKLTGGGINFLHKDDLDMFFDNEFQSLICGYLASAIDDLSRELLGIERYIGEFNEAISAAILPVLDDYGLELISFSVASLKIDDPSGKLREAYDRINIEQIEKIKRAQAENTVFDTLGDERWRLLHSAEILKTLAENEGTGGVAGIGAGLGMGIGAGSVFAGMTQQMTAPMQAQNAAIPAPAQESASSASRASDDVVSILKKLKEMFDLGLIEKSEYDAKKAEIMNRI
ncbi:MAG: SPFH domain-containing protein [Spirochaetota bacterium]|jgi:membrane protease subunit (stomatin/prohibitin family)|nr:SPFH domain-containing protein [Spirochaetota bacterium]